MTSPASSASLDFLWSIPMHGDGSWPGSEHLEEVAQAGGRLGFPVHSANRLQASS